MNETTHCVGGHHSKKPEDDEDCCNSPQHGLLSRAKQFTGNATDGCSATGECYSNGRTITTLRQVEQAIEDCRKVLQLNPYHYAAMIGLGHCHLEINDLFESLYWFRQALETYPDLEPVRVQVRRLEQAIQEP